MSPRGPRRIDEVRSSKPSIRKDSDLASHEFTILTVLRQRVEQLGCEANQCIGEEAAIHRRNQNHDHHRSQFADRRSLGLPENPIVSIPPVTAQAVSSNPQ